jgi:hypothetical protein
MARTECVNSHRGFHCRDGLFGGGIIVLGLALIWAARMVVVVHAQPLILEFISGDELER